MTTSRTLLPALLFLLASGSGQALADQAPPVRPADLNPVAASPAQAAGQIEARNPEAWDRVAWQRVGSPTRLAA
jgi:hypothetical protein